MNTDTNYGSENKEDDGILLDLFYNEYNSDNEITNNMDNKKINNEEEKEDKNSEDNENNEELEKLFENSLEDKINNEDIDKTEKKRQEQMDKLNKFTENDAFYDKIKTYIMSMDMIRDIQYSLNNNKTEEILKYIKQLVKLTSEKMHSVKSIISDKLNQMKNIKDEKNNNLLSRTGIIQTIKETINELYITKEELIKNITQYIKTDKYIVITSIYNIFMGNNDDNNKIIIQTLKDNDTLYLFIKQLKEETYDPPFDNNYNIKCIINLGDIEFLKEYMEDYHYNDTHVLLVAKEKYESNKNDINKKIFTFLKQKFNNKTLFYNKTHQTHCLGNDIYTIPKLFVESISRYKLYIIYMLPEFLQLNNKEIIEKVKNNTYKKKSFINIHKKEDNYNYEKIYKYIDYKFKLDLNWYKKQLKYLSKLSFNDKYTIFMYSGGAYTIINAYLLNNLTKNTIDTFVNIIKNDLDNSDKNFIYLFPQIMQVTNITDYDELVKHLKTYSDKYLARLCIKIMPLVISDIQRIINRSPSLDHSFTLYRGVRQIYYPFNDQYKTNTFTSTSPDIDIVKSFALNNYELNIMEFKLKKGDKCLFIEPITQTRNECEFILNIDKEFNIRKHSEKLPYYTINENNLCDIHRVSVNITTFHSK